MNHLRAIRHRPVKFSGSRVARSTGLKSLGTAKLWRMPLGFYLGSSPTGPRRVRPKFGGVTQARSFHPLERFADR